MDYRIMLRLQKCLYFNIYIFIVWVLVIGFFLYNKIDTIGDISKYLSIIVYTLLTAINSIRLYLGHSGNLSSRLNFVGNASEEKYHCSILSPAPISNIAFEAPLSNLNNMNESPINAITFLRFEVPELAGFLMLSVLMQMPLVSFFVFSPYLKNTPTEITLHAILWINTVLEILFSFLALKHASSIAKSIYLNHCKNKYT